MTKLPSFVWKSTGYIQSVPANPFTACHFNSYSEQNPMSFHSRRDLESIMAYSDSQLYKQKLKIINCVHWVVQRWAMTHKTNTDPWEYVVYLVFVSVHMQILQNKSFNCNTICLTLIPALCLQQYASKHTWTVKGKFDGRPARSSLASGELQMIIC